MYICICICICIEILACTVTVRGCSARFLVSPEGTWTQCGAVAFRPKCRMPVGLLLLRGMSRIQSRQSIN